MLGVNFCNAISRAMTRLLRYTLLGLLIVIGLIAVLIYSLTWRPEAKEACRSVATPRHRRWCPARR